ncbi:MAG TPA: hypothetical protein VFN87_03270 [Solirubrobacteraceae bacterium]|nr:hypothetical protein [Solirubrobacteraceae bacterium]
MQVCRSKWTVPGFAVAMGVIMLIAQAIGHHLGSGVVSLGIMVAFALVVLLGGRSETIRGLRGDGRDERFAQIDLRASWFAGMVLLVTVLGAFIVEMAQGRDGNPFTWLAAVAGVSYLVGVVVQRVRG